MSNCSHHHHHHDHGHDHDHLSPHDHAASASVAGKQAAALDGAAEAVFFIQNMDCPTEEKLIRAQLTQMDGIAALQFNLIQRELTVQHRLPSVAPIVATLSALDMLPKVKSDTLDATVGIDDDDHSASYAIPKRKWLMVGVAAVAALASEVIAWTTGNDRSLSVIALALFAIAVGGVDTLKK